MTTSVGYHNHMCIKLNIGQVDKSYMLVKANNAQLSIQVHLQSIFTWLLPGEKVTLNLASSSYPCWGHQKEWVEKLFTALRK